MSAVECLAGSGIVLAAALLATQHLRTASARHLAWVVAFAMLLALPLAIAVIPSGVRIVEHVEPAAPGAPVAAGVDYGAILVLAAFAVWFAGFFWVALRGLVGAAGLWRLHRRSVPYFLEGIDPARLDAGRPWKLRLSTMPGGAGPLTWGILRPVVLLPKCAVLWPRERMEAVLLHELAHVRRYDCLAQALSLLACALYWPNPLVWVGARALRREAEMAADDAVLVAGIKPSAYAGQLLDLASQFRDRHVAGLAMAAPSSLETRVTSVLAASKQRTGVTAMDALKFAGAGLVAVSLLALARPSFAAEQDEPVPPAATPAPPSVPAPATEAPTALAAPPQAPIAPPAPPVMTSAPPPPAAPPREHVVRWSDDHGTHVVRWVMPDVAAIMAQVRPEIEKAMDAHVAQIVADAMRQADGQMAEARARIAESRARDRVQADVDAALARADAAVARAQAQMERAQHRVERRLAPDHD